MRGTREHIVILIAAFVLFAGGVFALSMDRGNGRTVTLACIFGALLCLAVRVTLNRQKKRN